MAVAGGADAPPDYDLTNAYSAVLFSDGGMAAFASIGSRLRFFDAQGRPEKIVGRPGAGPGEFRSVHTALLVAGDTLLMLDHANNRLNKISRSGAFISVQALKKSMPFTAYAVAALPGNRVVSSEAGTWPKSRAMVASAE